MSTVRAAPLRVVKTQGPTGLTDLAREESLELRTATPGEVDAIDRLIVEHLAEGHLLPRTRDEIRVHVHRFVVVMDGDRVVACGELAPLSPAVAEIRSLVVDRGTRSHGVGQSLIEELLHRASIAGFEKLCAFTHSPAYFVHLGFSIVPHVWLPEKIVTDCHVCSKFRRCGQYAVVRTLGRTQRFDVPLAALHG